MNCLLTGGAENFGKSVPIEMVLHGVCVGGHKVNATTPCKQRACSM